MLQLSLKCFFSFGVHLTCEYTQNNNLSVTWCASEKLCLSFYKNTCSGHLRKKKVLGRLFQCEKVLRNSKCHTVTHSKICTVRLMPILFISKRMRQVLNKTRSKKGGQREKAQNFSRKIRRQKTTTDTYGVYERLISKFISHKKMLTKTSWLTMC